MWFVAVGLWCCVRQMTGVDLHGKVCCAYCNCTCWMQFLRSVGSVLVKIALLHVSRIHFLQMVSKYTGRWERLPWNRLMPYLRWCILITPATNSLQFWCALGESCKIDLYLDTSVLDLFFFFFFPAWGISCAIQFHRCIKHCIAQTLFALCFCVRQCLKCRSICLRRHMASLAWTVSARNIRKSLGDCLPWMTGSWSRRRRSSKPAALCSAFFHVESRFRAPSPLGAVCWCSSTHLLQQHSSPGWTAGNSLFWQNCAFDKIAYYSNPHPSPAK